MEKWNLAIAISFKIAQSPSSKMEKLQGMCSFFRDRDGLDLQR